MMRMDPAQAEAVRALGKNTIVSASAGAGKTRVLVERLIKRITEDGISLDQIVALTFTDAAAQEMKNRTAERLSQCLQNAADEAEKQRLREQIVLLDNADIVTIDSFCLSIVQKYYNVIGLDPALCENILDTSSGIRLQKNAFRDAVRSFDFDRMYRLLQYFSLRSADYDTLYGITDKLIRHADSSPDPDQWFARIRQKCTPVRSVNGLPEDLRTAFFASLRIRLSLCRDALEDMLRYADDTEKLQKGKDKLTAVIQGFSNLYRGLDARDYGQFRQQYISYAEGLKTPTDTKAPRYTAARKRFTDSMNRFASILYTEEQFVSDHNDMIPVMHDLTELACDIRHRFITLKQEETCMDFTDMERYALQILEKNDGAVSAVYQSILKEVMVDEFQDTSVLQNRIIELIAPADAIFRVGDVKQSIYRFRQAKPSLMRDLMKAPDNRVIVLPHNYRSKEPIVTFSNLLFRNLMNAEGLSDAYTENDTVSVGTDTQKITDDPEIELLLVDKPDGAEDFRAAQEKAELIARRIIELHEQGVSYGDICILVRAHNDKLPIHAVFDRHNIPFDIDVRAGFFNSLLCITITALLRCVLDPSDELSLTAVLTSPLFAVSDEELAQMKLKYGSIRTGVRKAYPKIMETLKNFRETERYHGIPAMLDVLADTNSFYVRLTDRDKANFDFLYDRIIGLQTDSIYDILTMMEEGEDENSSEAISHSKDQAVVSVTTIHQSKGLQYPIVFLWGTSTASARDASAPAVIDDTLGIGIRHVDLERHTVRQTMTRLAVEYSVRLEEAEEYSRLLYVALTRPEKKLYIVDVCKKDEDLYRENVPLSLVYSMPGITGLIRAGITDTPGIFRTVHLSPDRAKDLEEITHSYAKALPVFRRQVRQYTPIKRPSETEITLLPALSRTKGGTDYGTRMHELLEQMPAGGFRDSEIEALELTANEKKHISAFVHSDIYARIKAMQEYHEYPFFVTDQSTGDSILGTIDCLGISDSEVILIDYKTDNVSPSEIISRYSDQLNTYRQALQILHPDKRISVYAYSLHNDTVIEIKK